ncbi:aspartate aminotransferase family protein [Ferruginibacter sp. HRS2-29]|uniref:aspartate aminotransferase family protein n=1 Tax=Ferruginibacter sp. HRS2-29 TaxID=2487334 RepID=UPI0020CC9E58|nr:aspartate aminotransferase family protein [Ferruginibacter sp. HRS2-29]MCP9751701.1 aspartate aminotransferase family protein [Ferruginibacter sp. HRS2-29]
MNLRQLFLNHVGQTSAAPLCLNIVKASGSKMWDAEGKEYIDLIAGISVCNIGHRHPKVVEAIKKQVDEYLHIMVYGEFIENPQVQYAKLITEHLPSSLNAVFYTASGAEATEGAMKLAKRYTGRTQIISFKNSYHGSTQGALSIMGSEYWQQAFRPLLPDTMQLCYNNFEGLENITERTACVVAETIQAEAGVIAPKDGWMKALRERCTATGTLLVLDEIQCGFGRNGSLWAFEQFDVVPDILLLGKALGGGMPLGAFVSDKKIMDSFTNNPVLGHINTFGGHPVSCAAGLAGMQVLLEEKMIDTVPGKEKLFRNLLQHKAIQNISSHGLMMAVEFDSFETNKKVIDLLIEQGVFTDWFLFAANAFRIVPPLNISEEEISDACNTILRILDNL